MEIAIKQNGVLKAGAFQELYVLPDDHSKWLRVFYHNNKSGIVLFKSVAEARHCSNVDKFSRLDMLDQLRDSDGKYEFLLRYPIDSTGYNRWKQNDNPCNLKTAESEAGAPVPEYTAIHIDWDSNHWGGLEREWDDANKAGSASYLCGSTGHNNWFYAIGSFEKFQSGIPKWSDNTTSIVELYVRYDTLAAPFNVRFSNSNELIASDIIEI